jgi:hypothetical protein
MTNKPPPQPSLYELFEATSLQNCQRLLDNGEIPAPELLADILEANADRPLPAWFIELVAKSLKGELKRKSGRPRETLFARCRFAAAEHEYLSLLKWLVKREKTLGLKGWSILRGKEWWEGPPHERAAKITTEKWRLHMSWRSLLNRVSSEK